MKAKLVSGYVRLDLPLSHRTHADYRALGARLEAVPVPKQVFVEYPLESCWMYKFLKTVPPVTHSVEHNPNKNSLEYHIVQHQKVEWMLDAALEDHEHDVFVWVDYGVFHNPSITEQAIVDLIARCNEPDIAIPGIYDASPDIPDATPCWRFCGTVLICHRRWLPILAAAIRGEAEQHIRETGNVSWEVNGWARVEQKYNLPIHWYPAQHDNGMFKNYAPH